MKLRSVIAATALALAALPAQASGDSAHLDLTFGDEGIFVRPPSPERFSSASDMAIGPDGQVVVLGSRYVEGISGWQTAFGFDADGRPDPNFGTSGPGATDLLVGNFPRALGFVDGKLLIATLGFTEDLRTRRPSAWSASSRMARSIRASARTASSTPA